MRKSLTTSLAAFLGAAALTLTGAVAAQAHHAPPVLDEPRPGECGETILFASMPTDPHGSYANTALVVQAGDTYEVAPLGVPIVVGPFEADTTIQYRVWGGGERGYDSPAVADLDALVAYLDADEDRSPVDQAAPGVAWHKLPVDGCPADDDTDNGDDGNGDDDPGNGGDDSDTGGDGGDDKTPGGTDAGDDDKGQIGDGKGATPAPVPTAVPAGYGDLELAATGTSGSTVTLLGLLGAAMAIGGGWAVWRFRPGHVLRGRYRA